MSTIVIMPGGFHPFHAGHAALYNSAKRAFPDADVYVAATNDTSSRPFSFAIKEKLAQLAGVDKGRFMQVKSPFRAEEITAPYNPKKDKLIFIRSQKDADKQPLAGGVKKDGEPAYLQPLESAAKLEPFGKHAYMAYLPTVEFGPGMTSATEIRTAWPTLNEKRKTALVMSLYPKTQNNPQLAATVVKMLDTAMGTVDESALDNLPRPNKRNQFKSLHKQRKQRGLDEQGVVESNKQLDELFEPTLNYYTLSNGKKVQVSYRPNINQSPVPFTDVTVSYVDPALKPMGPSFDSTGVAQPWTSAPDGVKQAIQKFATQPTQGVAEMGGQNFVGGMTASYQRRENQPVAEDYMEEKRS